MAPPTLYKYCTPHGIDILRNLRLKITPPNQFNDPFELAPRMEEQLSREKAFEALTEPLILKMTYQNLIGTGQFFGTYQDFLDAIQRHSERFVQGLADNYVKSAAEFRREHINTVSAEFGLICLSEIPDDILMWSHYTRSHTGFVVGFRTSHPFFAGGPILDVVYQEERVLIGQSVRHSDPVRTEQVNALIRRKSPHWKYEREWRQLHFLKECILEEGNEAGPAKYFKPFTNDLVSEIIIGCRADVQLAGEIRQLLTNGHFPEAKLSTYRMHDSEFSLIPE